MDAKLRLTIPYTDAFGAAGVPGLVPPFATVYARVEVVGHNPPSLNEKAPNVAHLHCLAFVLC